MTSADRADPTRSPAALWLALSDMHFADDGQLLAQLIREATLPAEMSAAVTAHARDLAIAVRSGRRNSGGIDAFMQEYDLSNP